MTENILWLVPSEYILYPSVAEMKFLLMTRRWFSLSVAEKTCLYHGGYFRNPSLVRAPRWGRARARRPPAAAPPVTL